MGVGNEEVVVASGRGVLTEIVALEHIYRLVYGGGPVEEQTHGDRGDDVPLARSVLHSSISAQVEHAHREAVLVDAVHQGVWEGHHHREIGDSVGIESFLESEPV